jgi:hypothetical protein
MDLKFLHEGLDLLGTQAGDAEHLQDAGRKLRAKFYEKGRAVRFQKFRYVLSYIGSDSLDIADGPVRDGLGQISGQAADGP